MKASEIPNPLPMSRNKNFIILLLAQFFAVAALYALNFAAVIAVAERTLSITQTGLTILSSILPSFVGSLFAGVVVDRFDRRRVLMAAHLIRTLAGLAFWIFVSIMANRLGFLPIYILLMVSALFTQFALAAELAILPHFAPSDQLIRANSLLQISMLAAEGLGIVVIAPWMTKTLGAGSIGLVCAVLTFIAFVLVARLPRLRVRETQEGQDAWGALRSMGEDFQAGWETILRDRVLRIVTAQFALTSMLLLMVLSMAPTLAALYLGIEVADVAFLMVPGGVGFGLGALIVSRLGNRYPRLRWISGGLIAVGGSIALIVALSNGPVQWRVPLVVGAIFGMGIALAMTMISARTVVQERPAPAMRGRVIAAQLALASALSVLPLLIGGAIADRVGINSVMLLLSLVALGSGAAGLYRAQG